MESNRCSAPLDTLRESKSVNYLTANELTNLLASDTYILPHIREKMEKRLFYLRQDVSYNKSRGASNLNRTLNSSLNSTRENAPHFPGSHPAFVKDESRGSSLNSSSATSTSTSNLAIRGEDFPELFKTSDVSILKSSTSSIPSTESSSSSFSYKNIVNNSASNKTTLKTELFVGNELMIDYLELEKIYRSYAANRIHINFLNLDRKINILNMSDQTSKDLFKYDELCVQRKFMKQCLKLYIFVHGIITKLNAAIPILYEMADELEEIYITDKTFMLTIKPLYDISVDFSTFTTTRYHVRFPTTINQLENCKEIFNQEILIDPTSITNKIFYLKKLKKILFTIQKTFLDTVDPKIQCEYYVMFKTFAEGTIIPVGISSYKYHTIGNISMEPYVDEKYPNILSDTIIKKLFKETYKSNSSSIVNISIPESTINQLHINFTIGDTILFSKGTINLYNQPPNTTILSSIITNDSASNTTTTASKILTPKLNNYDRWLDTRTRNNLFIPTESEYAELSTNLTTAYELHDTDKNIFFADYVFDMLSDFDANEDIINANMIDSFRELAYVTSVRNSNITKNLFI